MWILAKRLADCWFFNKNALFLRGFYFLRIGVYFLSLPRLQKLSLPVRHLIAYIFVRHL